MTVARVIDMPSATVVPGRTVIVDGESHVVDLVNDLVHPWWGPTDRAFATAVMVDGLTVDLFHDRDVPQVIVMDDLTVGDPCPNCGHVMTTVGDPVECPDCGMDWTVKP